jgi:hypothetical protein
MSWSVLLIGSPENIVSALNKESDRLTGDSKAEFDKVLPALTTLVQQNYNADNPTALKLQANGHAYSTNGEPKYGTCNIVIENLGSALV